MDRQFVNSSVRQFDNSSIRQSSNRQFVNSSIRRLLHSARPIGPPHWHLQFWFDERSKQTIVWLTFSHHDVIHFAWGLPTLSVFVALFKAPPRLFVVYESLYLSFHPPNIGEAVDCIVEVNNYLSMFPFEWVWARLRLQESDQCCFTITFWILISITVN